MIDENPVNTVAETPLRLLREPRIYVGIATAGTCYAHFTLSLARLLMQFCKEKLSDECTDQHITVGMTRGSVICWNYHQLVHQAKEWGATHLFTVEDDMGFAPNVLHVLYRKRQLWAAANYPFRTDEFHRFTAADVDGNWMVTGEDSCGLQPATTTGMGVTLFDMSIFNKVTQPWFKHLWLDDTQTYCTQDSYFARKCCEAGIQPYVDHDASKLVWHIGHKDFNYLETSRRIAFEQKRTERA